MVIKVTPYQKSVLLGLVRQAGVADENAIVEYLRSVGWHGEALTIEKVDATLEDLKEIGLVTDDEFFCSEHANRLDSDFEHKE